jgi:hypothetical protein
MAICSNSIFRWRSAQHQLGLRQICPAGSTSLLRPSKSISTKNILIFNEGSQS